MSDAPLVNPESRAAAGNALGELAAVFLKLGATAFGGPAVHIAMLEQEVVHRRKWLSHAEFLDLLGVTNLIPGPNSTEMAIHIGLRRGGWKGLIIAGVCFIAPAFVIVLACAWFYVRFARLPEIQGVLYGVKPVVLAVVLQALWRLGHKALSTRLMTGIAIAALASSLLGVHELLILLVAGIATPIVWGMATRWSRPPVKSVLAVMPPFVPIGLIFPAAAASPAVGLAPLFLFFVKVGSVLYGSGYVLLAFLRGDLVQRWGWLTESQLLDAIAVGQITPGPLFTTATFVGYVLAGPAGAGVATAGIFLPAFFFVAVSAPLIPRLRRSPVAGAFLDGVNAASLALMAAVTLQLLGGAMVDATTIVLGLVSAVVLLTTRTNPIWLIAVAGVTGLVLH